MTKQSYMHCLHYLQPLFYIFQHLLGNALYPLIRFIALILVINMSINMSINISIYVSIYVSISIIEGHADLQAHILNLQQIGS